MDSRVANETLLQHLEASLEVVLGEDSLVGTLLALNPEGGSWVPVDGNLVGLVAGGPDAAVGNVGAVCSVIAGLDLLELALDVLSESTARSLRQIDVHDLVGTVVDSLNVLARELNAERLDGFDRHSDDEVGLMNVSLKDLPKAEEEDFELDWKVEVRLG